MLLVEKLHKALSPWDTAKSRANRPFFSELRFQIRMALKAKTMQFPSSEQTSHLVPMQAFQAIFSGHMKEVGLVYQMTGRQ